MPANRRNAASARLPHRRDGGIGLPKAKGRRDRGRLVRERVERAARQILPVRADEVHRSGARPAGPPVSAGTSADAPAGRCRQPGRDSSRATKCRAKRPDGSSSVSAGGVSGSPGCHAQPRMPPSQTSTHPTRRRMAPTWIGLPSSGTPPIRTSIVRRRCQPAGRVGAADGRSRPAGSAASTSGPWRSGRARGRQRGWMDLQAAVRPQGTPSRAAGQPSDRLDQAGGVRL